MYYYIKNMSLLDDDSAYNALTVNRNVSRHLCDNAIRKKTLFDVCFLYSLRNTINIKFYYWKMETLVWNALSLLFFLEDYDGINFNTHWQIVQLVIFSKHKG